MGGGGWAVSKLISILETANIFAGSLVFGGAIVLLGFVPYLVARLLLQWTQTALPTGGHGVVLLLFFSVLLSWAWMISGDRGSQLFRRLYSLGIWWPFLFSISLLIFATLCFASLTSTLSDLGRVQFEPAIPRGEFWRVQDFYSWHFFNSIPGLNIPETLLWKKPFTYKDPLTGVVLLLFKLVVIIPVIGSFAVWNRIRKESKQANQETARGT